jgi:hypothetical protein
MCRHDQDRGHREGRRVAVARGSRQWFEEFEARRFDDKIERDARAGKLDKLIHEARANHAAGRREEF